jgi:hypothetical protein
MNPLYTICKGNVRNEKGNSFRSVTETEIWIVHKIGPQVNFKPALVSKD